MEADPLGKCFHFLFRFPAGKKQESPYGLSVSPYKTETGHACAGYTEKRRRRAGKAHAEEKSLLLPRRQIRYWISQHKAHTPVKEEIGKTQSEGLPYITHESIDAAGYAVISGRYGTHDQGIIRRLKQPCSQPHDR